MTVELNDAEIEAIQAEAEDFAIHCGQPNAVINPYSDATRAEIWAHSFRSAYARENGR